MNEPEKLIPPHGGYRKLKSFQVAQLTASKAGSWNCCCNCRTKANYQPVKNSQFCVLLGF